jgi:hypothetical protein
MMTSSLVGLLAQQPEPGRSAPFLILSGQSLQLFTTARQPVAEFIMQAVQVRPRMRSRDDPGTEGGEAGLVRGATTARRRHR